MVGHHSTRFGDHRHCGSGYMFLLVDGQDSKCSRLNLPLMKLMTCHINRSNSGHTLPG